MPAPAVRRAAPADAATLGRLLWDFNTEFGTETDPADVLAARFERLLDLDDVIAVLGGDEIDTDTRRFHERQGFLDVEEGTDYRMLYYVGPTDPAVIESR